MNIKEKLESLLDSMNDAYETVLANYEKIEGLVDKIFEVEEFIEQNSIYIEGFDAQDIVYNLRYGFLGTDTDVTYMVNSIDEIMNELKNYKYDEYNIIEYGNLYYILDDIFNDLDTSTIEIIGMDDYLETLKMQIDTIKSELSNWD